MDESKTTMRLDENAGTPHAANKTGSAWKWWLTGVLFLATVLTYLDRQTMSLCGEMITQEFQLTEQQFGELLAAFRWFYAFTHLAAGFVADRVAVRGVYAIAVGVWSAAGAAAAFVTGFRPLLWTRRLLGVGEAFNWPCATRIVATMLPPQDRGLASGIFNSGAAVGSLIAPFVITPLAIAFGWRMAFLVMGAWGAVWIAIWLFATRSSTAAHQTAATVQHADVPHRGAATVQTWRDWMREVLFHPGFWMLVVVALTVNPCWYFLNDWIPKYMVRAHQTGYIAAGLFTVPIFLAADVGNLASGGLIKLLTLRGWSLPEARGATLTVAAALVLPVAAVPVVTSPYLVVALLAMGGLGITSIVANFTACQQDLSFRNVGMVAGILGMSSNVFAAVVQPWIGHYVDVNKKYDLIFQLVAVVPLLSLAAILIFDRLVWHKRGGSQSTSSG